MLLAHLGAAAPERALRSAATGVLPLTLLAIWLTDSRGGEAAVLLGLAILLRPPRIALGNFS